MARSIAEIEAELEVRKLEEQLVAAKENGSPPPDLKAEVRQARHHHRSLRDARPPEPGEARPGTVGTSAGIQE